MARTWHGVLARLGVRTGDGRILSEGGGASRELPLPLSYQRVTDDGHRGSELIGRIESVRIQDGMVTATGSLFDSVPYDVVEAIESGAVGPSVDLDDFEYVMDADENLVLTRWRVAGTTVVQIPAFADVHLTLDPEPVPAVYEEAGFDGWDAYGAELASFATRTLERLADTRADLPSEEWFRDPQLTGVTPLTVTEDGRVFGHIAPWGECHVGLPGCVTAPVSEMGYAHFHTGVQQTREGVQVPAGALVTGPRHADPQLAFRAAQAHYDDLSSTVARVVAGEDSFGIWVAGAMVPGADPVRVEQFMASPVSGDWRRVGGSLELIAVCSVNAPGFPVHRARVAFSAGEQQALVGSFGVTAQRGEAPAVAAVEQGVRADVARAKYAWTEV